MQLDTASLTVRPALLEFAVECATAVLYNFNVLTSLMAQEQNSAPQNCGFIAEFS